MQQVKVGGEIFRQIQEQTERKCENCKKVSLKCFLHNDPIDKCFEQKPITISIPIEVFRIMKHPPFEEGRRTHVEKWVLGKGTICSEQNCELNNPLPKQGDKLKLVCEKCGGEGFRLKNRFEDIPKTDRAKLIRVKEDCPTCKGVGSVSLKVLKVTKFGECSFTCNRVLIEGELCGK